GQRNRTGSGKVTAERSGGEEVHAPEQQPSDQEIRIESPVRPGELTGVEQGECKHLTFSGASMSRSVAATPAGGRARGLARRLAPRTGPLHRFNATDGEDDTE